MIRLVGSILPQKNFEKLVRLKRGTKIPFFIGENGLEAMQ